MKELTLLLGLMLISLPSFSQKKNAEFPEDYFGIYKGILTINQASGEVQEIPMEFHLLATDTAQRFVYKLVYNGQPRNYMLIEKDAEKGIYTVDENNGIILPSRYIDRTLYSYFQVGESFLNSRLSFSKKKLEFEILFTNMEARERTGEDTDYEIYGYPITTVQKAVLRRK
ncbi:MAG: hypothetical protein AAF740_07330 [Bacteroidota bacterium]